MAISLNQFVALRELEKNVENLKALKDLNFYMHNVEIRG